MHRQHACTFSLEAHRSSFKFKYVSTFTLNVIRLLLEMNFILICFKFEGTRSVNSVECITKRFHENPFREIISSREVPLCVRKT